MSSTVGKKRPRCDPPAGWQRGPRRTRRVTGDAADEAEASDAAPGDATDSSTSDAADGGAE